MVDSVMPGNVSRLHYSSVIKNFDGNVANTIVILKPGQQWVGLLPILLVEQGDRRNFSPWKILPIPSGAYALQIRSRPRLAISGRENGPRRASNSRSRPVCFAQRCGNPPVKDTVAPTCHHPHILPTIENVK